MAQIVVSNTTAWAPGLVSNDDWKKWAHGEKSIEKTNGTPKLEYVDAIFRRRFSQISKMTIQVVHDVLEKSQCGKDTPQVFISHRGELAREFAVSKMIVEEKEVMPASFSLSVFNTPIALASISLGLHGGYSAVFPSKGNFRSAFEGACASVLSGTETEVVLAYADELAPEAYKSLDAGNCDPFAFAAVLSLSGNGVRISDVSAVSETAADFLKDIILKDTSF